MRVHTVATFALASMAATSVGVWALTSPESATATLAAEPPSIAGAPQEVDRSHFTAGATLMLEGRLGHARMPANRDQSTFLLANISGASNAQAASSPLDLTIVIDRSGSMLERGRLTNAIEGARGMIRRLRDQDRVSVITYSDDAQLLVPPTVIDSFSRERVVAALAGIRASGDTCISCGMDMAMQVTAAQPDRVSRILLLSDGEATRGVRDEAGFQAIAQRARMMGTTVSTIGVDIEYDERTMGTLAQFSNGRHYFVETPMQLPTVFDRELESLSRTVANQVELVVDLADGVQADQVFDRAMRREQNRIIVPIGTVAPGEQKTVLVALRVPTREVGERAVADVRLRYVDLSTRAPGECGGTLAAVAVGDPSQASELDPFVAARVSRSETVTAVREANDLSRNGQFDLARARLAQRRAELDHERARVVAGPAPAPTAVADFGAQDQALAGAGQGFGAPGLAAPATSEEGRAGRRHARAQERANAGEVLDAFSR